MTGESKLRSCISLVFLSIKAAAWLILDLAIIYLGENPAFGENIQFDLWRKYALTCGENMAVKAGDAWCIPAGGKPLNQF